MMQVKSATTALGCATTAQIRPDAAPVECALIAQQTFQTDDEFSNDHNTEATE